MCKESTNNKMQNFKLSFFHGCNEYKIITVPNVQELRSTFFHQKIYCDFMDVYFRNVLVGKFIVEAEEGMDFLWCDLPDGFEVLPDFRNFFDNPRTASFKLADYELCVDEDGERCIQDNLNDKTNAHLDYLEEV